MKADICAFLLARRGADAGAEAGDADADGDAGAGDSGGASDPDADAGAGEGLGAGASDAGLFDVALFLRFTHKGAIARLPSVLRTRRRRDECERERERECEREREREGEREGEGEDCGALVAAEAFHVTTPHPSDSAQQLAEGELAQLLRADGTCDVETVVEQLVSAEDGRPLLQSVCRVRRRR